MKKYKIITLALFLSYEFLVVLATAVLTLFFHNSMDIGVLTENTVLTIIGLIIPILIYINLGAINAYFRVSAIIYVLLEADVIYALITQNTINHSLTLIAVELGTALELVLDYFFIKGLVSMYSDLNEKKYLHMCKELKYYKYAFILIFAVSVVSSLLDGMAGKVLAIIYSICLFALFVERLFLTLKTIIFLRKPTK